MKYYIADLHFGHQNIISLCNRPFSTIEDMERTLIQNWNQSVNEKDEVYIVGDLFYRCLNAEHILKQLSGRKILITGNHDKDWINDEGLLHYFESVHQYLEITDQHQRVFLCHYPMLSYPKQSKTYMIHGHIHTDTLLDYWHVLLKRQRVLNAGVDINHFKPVSLNELVINNQKYKQTMLNSYPQTLVSIRFNAGELIKQGIDKTQAIFEIKKVMHNYNIEFIKEGLYEITCPEAQKKIDEIIRTVQESPSILPLFKNFDLISVDEQGIFSFISQLNKNA